MAGDNSVGEEISRTGAAATRFGYQGTAWMRRDSGLYVSPTRLYVPGRGRFGRLDFLGLLARRSFAARAPSMGQWSGYLGRYRRLGRGRPIVVLHYQYGFNSPNRWVDVDGLGPEGLDVPDSMTPDGGLPAPEVDIGEYTEPGGGPPPTWPPEGPTETGGTGPGFEEETGEPAQPRAYGDWAVYHTNAYGQPVTNCIGYALRLGGALLPFDPSAPAPPQGSTTQTPLRQWLQSRDIPCVIWTGARPKACKEHWEYVFEAASLCVVTRYPPGKDPFDAPWIFYYSAEPPSQFTDVQCFRGREEGWTLVISYGVVGHLRVNSYTDAEVWMEMSKNGGRPTLCCRTFYS